MTRSLETNVYQISLLLLRLARALVCRFAEIRMLNQVENTMNTATKHIIGALAYDDVEQISAEPGGG